MSLALPELAPARAPRPRSPSPGLAIVEEKAELELSPIAEALPPLDAHILDQRSDFIEQIFTKVEKESEMRAYKQQLDDELSRPTTASSSSPQPSSNLSSPGPVTISVPREKDATRERDRRRGSISVSRFGQNPEVPPGTFETASNLPSRKNSLIINAGSTGAFYQAQRYAGSADSFASESEPPHAQEHDEEQVTQMETIAGRMSLGKAVGRTIARRLSRAKTRSRDILTQPNGLMIGVSVEEATVEAHHDAEEEGMLNGSDDMPRTPVTAFVYADAAKEGTRSRRSTISMPNPPPGIATQAAPTTPSPVKDDKKPPPSSWVARAKDISRMIKRRSLAVLPQNAHNSSP
ncbi:uncharacterized protein BXZ73DRAFT_55864 [Epithele typhae]|uniref:uncharacterized protein n=1 Tax=Epithele typhae TaxID=378194 RepID=UPI00200736DA|nr:uncharacterized protein BXZ73DRAFT_55864 [Epithele typhae]KAH9912768.1 hypothetical protein BXZ73DRAFT_55864 [Epithele typhae]